MESHSRLACPGTVRAWEETWIVGSISRRLSSFPSLLDLCAAPLLECVHGVSGEGSPSSPVMAHRESDLQTIVNKFAEASCLFGLSISLGKTEVLFQSAPPAFAHRPTISVNGTQLKPDDDFSVNSSDRSLDKEISTRISKASQALGRLKIRVLSQHNIRQSTKLKVYREVVLASLFYGCEIWTLCRRHLKELGRFLMRSLRTILNIKWQDLVSNLQVLAMAESTSIEAMILKSRLRWVGNVVGMEDNRQSGFSRVSKTA